MALTFLLKYKKIVLPASTRVFLPFHSSMNLSLFKKKILSNKHKNFTQESIINL